MTNEAITQRFFEAIEYLKANKVIRGLNTFTERYDINRRNLIIARNDPTRQIVKMSYLAYLVSDYHINPNWLLTGRGKIVNGKV